MTASPPIVSAATVAAGTQVVLLHDVLNSNKTLLHPAGVVGIVARTPAGIENHYLIRLPDGFETSLPRGQFEILKHFKDRLPPPATGTASATARPDDFALETHIIYRCVVGSRAYGLDTDASDTDVRGVYIAPAEMHWSLFGVPEQFEDNTAQTCYWELQKFLIMALKANPNILECLYSPLVEKQTPLGERLVALRGRFLSKMIFQTFNGYALSQFKKLEQDMRNQGEIRWKHAMHLIRLLITGAATLREHRVPVCAGTHRERLLALKRGELAWPEVNTWRLKLHADFEDALKHTTLPDRPDYEAANTFLVDARRSQTTK